MRYNVYFTLRSAVGQNELHCRQNPIECASLASLLVDLAANLPRSETLGLETVGIRVEPLLSVDEAFCEGVRES